MHTKKETLNETPLLSRGQCFPPSAVCCLACGRGADLLGDVAILLAVLVDERIRPLFAGSAVVAGADVEGPATLTALTGKTSVTVPKPFVLPSRNINLVPTLRYSARCINRKRTKPRSPVRKIWVEASSSCSPGGRAFLFIWVIDMIWQVWAVALTWSIAWYLGLIVVWWYKIVTEY